LRKRARAQSVLYVVLFLPAVLLVFALVVDVGSLQMQKLRLRWAMHIATVGAATVIDPLEHSRTGRIRLDPSRATAVAREYIYLNLAPLGPSVGGSRGARAIADRAEVAVINRIPARDPFSGALLDRPAVCARIQAPYNLGLLHLAGRANPVWLTVTANAEVKT
jgi:hypothetical protein